MFTGVKLSGKLLFLPNIPVALYSSLSLALNLNGHLIKTLFKLNDNISAQSI